MELFIPLAVALVAIVAIWKLFKGIVKTVALVGVAVLAAIHMFGTEGLG